MWPMMIMRNSIIRFILRDAHVLRPCITTGHFLQLRVNQGSRSAVGIEDIIQKYKRYTMQYKTGANGCSFTVRPVSISDNRGVPHNQSKSQNSVNLTPTWQVAAVLKGKNFYFRELVFFQNDNLRGGMVVASSNYSRIMVIIIPIQTCWLGAQTNL